MRTAMNEFPRDCAMWMQAFEAKFDGKGQPFTRQQWDQLLARYSVSTPLLSKPSNLWRLARKAARYTSEAGQMTDQLPVPVRPASHRICARANSGLSCGEDYPHRS